ncbi:transglycosylase family protein, partial [Streptomyces sparsus]
MPLLAASGASAAEAPTWDRVAECESGGVWSSNAGNGYYGGLQLTLSTWEKFGGTAYADRPDLASRSQQIAVAEKILNSEGPDAWPGCAVTSGLHEDPTAVPDIDPGDLPAASSSPEADDTSAGATPGGQSESSRSESAQPESAQPESTQRESTRQGGGSTQQERGSAPTDGPSGSSQSPAPDRSTPAPATSGAPSTGASPSDTTSPAERGKLRSRGRLLDQGADQLRP